MRRVPISTACPLLLVLVECGNTVTGSGDAAHDIADALTDTTADTGPIACALDSDCPTGQVCEHHRGVCVQCAQNSDCPSGQPVCASNVCTVAIPCTSARMCPGQVCDTTNGFCVDCLTSVDCPMGGVCRHELCGPPAAPCTSSRTCSTTGLVCDTARMICVECVTDADCDVSQQCGAGEECVPRSAADAGPDAIDAPRDTVTMDSPETDTSPDVTDAGGGSVPRLIAPLSTARVTSQTPTLRWQLAAGSSGVHVEICDDRACTHAFQTFDASGSSGAPATSLTAGLYFWHARSSSGTAYSATWEFWVGARSAAVDTSWGTTLDVNGDGFADLVVGADGVGGGVGNATVFAGSAAGIATTPASTLNGPIAGGQFGWTVASAGDVNGDGFADVIVGAPYAESGTGRAYVYLGRATGLDPLAAPTSTLVGPDGPMVYFANSVASAGDVNGDGFADVIIGAPAVNANTGRAYVYLGSTSGLATTPTTTLVGPDGPGGAFGVAVASAGDVNGDEFADVIVGAPNVRRAYVYVGSASGLATTIATSLVGTDPPGGAFGISVACAGDVNGDGLADVVVGSDRGGDGSGNAYVYLGGTLGLATAPTTSLPGPGGAGGAFGHSVASAGDVDGDGFGDLVVGASVSGAAYVYFGSTGGVVSTSAVTLSGPSKVAYFGYSVAGIGDVNRDGLADVAVGTEAASAHPGTVQVYLGGAAGFASVAPTILSSVDGTGADFGISVASISTKGAGTDAVVDCASPRTHLGRRMRRERATTSTERACAPSRVVVLALVTHTHV